MPIQRQNYDEKWEEISHYVRFVRANGHCEGSPAYPTCTAAHGQPHPLTGKTVYLQTAHIDQNPANNDETNLRAWCPLCHNTFDAPYRWRNRRRHQRERQCQAGQLQLID